MKKKVLVTRLKLVPVWIIVSFIQFSLRLFCLIPTWSSDDMEAIGNYYGDLWTLLKMPVSCLFSWCIYKCTVFFGCITNSCYIYCSLTNSPAFWQKGCIYSHNHSLHQWTSYFCWEDQNVLLTNNNKHHLLVK